MTRLKPPMVTARACHEEPDGKNKMGAKPVDL